MLTHFLICYFNLLFISFGIFYSLRVSLFHESVEVRAAGFRAMRYLLKNEEAVESLYKINLHYMIARSLDIDFNNKSERIQCLRLVRKLLSLKPNSMPSCLARSVVAIARDGLVGLEKDLLVRASWATLAELALLNPKVCFESGGIPAILNSILVANQPHHISEALISSILYLLNDPRLRYYLRADLDLQHFLAPFTDCHYSLPFFNTHKSSDSGIETPEQKESRFSVAKNALISILRSWPGLVYLCKASDNKTNISNGLRSLIEIFHLPYVDTRKYLMELIFELYYLTIPAWTCDFQAALLSCNSSSLQDSFHVYDGFVAAEGKHILPHLAKHRQNLLENYLSLLLYSFITNGLLDGLVSLITISNNIQNCVRATILLGELLHLSSQLLPPEVSERCHSLPKLVDAAISSSNTAEQRNIASAAISCLNRMHSLKKNPTLACSLYLDQLLQFCSLPIRKSLNYLSVSKTKLKQYFKKGNDDSSILTLIKECQVLKKEPVYWIWSLIGFILKSPSESLMKFEESNHKIFIRKLINYYKPTSKLYSQLESGAENGQEICLVGGHLIDFLLDAEESKAVEYLEEFLVDLSDCFTVITNENCPSNAILSVTRMISTWSHTYFLFIGRLSSSSKGRTLLEKVGLYQNLLDLISLASHEIYLKLIVSSLYYNQENNFTRILFIKMLTCSLESARLYATNYIRVLIRAEILDFQKWALELLSNQLCDKSSAVVQAALDILDEACDNQENLKTLISLRPSLLHVGDRGLLLFIRYLSTPVGFNFLKNANFLNYELNRWKENFNLKYVKIVEDLLNETLSCHQRSEDGTYGRRSDKKINSKKTAFTPPHLYGELAKHQEGLELLIQEKLLDSMFQIVRDGCFADELKILQLKAALWAIGNVGASYFGFQLIVESHLIPIIVKLAAEASVISIRGTCFYVLGLLASTEDGADYLKKLGWETVRHCYNDKWPMIKESNNFNLEDECFSLSYFHSKKQEMSSSRSRFLELFDMVSGKQKGFKSVDSFVFTENSHLDSNETINSITDGNQTSKADKKSLTGQSLCSNKTLNKSNDFSIQHSSLDDESRPRSTSDGINQNSFEYIDNDSNENDGLWLKYEKQSEELKDSVASLSLGSNEAKKNEFVSSHNEMSTKIKQREWPVMAESGIRRKISEPWGPQHLNSMKIPECYNGYRTVMIKLTESKAKLNSILISSEADNCFNQKGQKLSLRSNSLSNTFTGTDCKDVSFNSHTTSQGRPLFKIGKETSDIFDYIPSAMDALGYATLRSIQRKRAKSLGIQLHTLNKEGRELEDNSEEETTKSSDTCNSLSSFFNSNTSEVNQIEDADFLGSVEPKKYMGLCIPVSLSLIFHPPVR